MGKENKNSIQVFLPESLQNKCRDSIDIMIRDLEVSEYLRRLVRDQTIPPLKYETTTGFYKEKPELNNGLLVIYEDTYYLVKFDSKNSNLVYLC